MNILLGVTGGIAAYKAPIIVRRLKDRGASVRVVMTRSAREFVTATTLQAVSGEPVRDSLWDPQAEAAMGHIELARWADRVLIAPATAEFLSRLAQGSAADLLTTLCLATRAPITVVPAMNNAMWAHAAVQENCATLRQRGVALIEPDEGPQACGEFGPGRMPEPESIVDTVLGASSAGVLANRTVLVTAGPTREAIDPVRYISNHSSGKMGYALAEAARDAGARVLLLSGPVSLAAPDGVQRVMIESAAELHAAAHERIAEADVFIAAAAVADYRPAEASPGKIKKEKASMRLDLVRSPDVLASVAALPDAPFTVGFAAETDDVAAHARKKLDDKRINLIIANDVSDGKVFGQDDNTVHAFWRGGDRAWPTMDKKALARELVALIADRLAADRGGKVTELPSIASRD
ncbi:MAG: bifunctional phosphopantothenoylcysteine decarboxylase/phosphopantothenate--cysteine ligase CoaBC [Woeseiaceae bacterium]|nr:bifunctional phosphopantothenoylcysteine decarboxylase/phosphopantothenate--cysteine ligase CoaBC [Woeseiaceae bacterium]